MTSHRPGRASWTGRLLLAFLLGTIIALLVAEGSKSATLATAIEQQAVCWFDLLTPDEEATVKALPSSDSGSGKNSDYCI